VIPFFCRHSLNAAKRDAPGREPPAVEVVALALVLDDDLAEEPPHAASTRAVSTRAATAIAGLLALLWI
jgi:hypothetical protein